MAARSAPAADAAYSADPVPYRRAGDGPRQRVAFVDLADGGAGQRPDMYRAGWPARHRGRRRGRTMPVLVALGVFGAAAGGIVAVTRADPPATVPVAIDAALLPRTTATALRASAAPPSPARTRSVPAPAPKTSSPAPRAPRPVAGLSRKQMNNAAVIVRAARERGLPRRAMLVAVMTAVQESRLSNLANPSVPASLDRPHEGSGSNFDSLGVFQQRPSQGWGSVAELMDPRYAADAFYDRLLKVRDWESKSLGDAAQAVQRSGVPDAYANHEDLATTVVDALL